jgi:hypothetical protein
MKLIDLGSVRTSNVAKVLSGRPRGEFCRKHFQLESFDCSEERAIVSVPSDMLSVNSAFFLACFGESVRTLGKEEFGKKYRFVCSGEIRKEFDTYIDLALKAKSPFTM